MHETAYPPRRVITAKKTPGERKKGGFAFPFWNEAFLGVLGWAPPGLRQGGALTRGDVRRLAPPSQRIHATSGIRRAGTEREMASETRRSAWGGAVHLRAQRRSAPSRRQCHPFARVARPVSLSAAAGRVGPYIRAGRLAWTGRGWAVRTSAESLHPDGPSSPARPCPATAT